MTRIPLGTELRRVAFGALLSLIAASPLLPARAATNPPATPTAATFKLEGFRSAKFGMTDAQVRAAITKDFNVKPEAIKSEEHPVQKTQILSVIVPNLLVSTGKAEITYTFGYKSHTLIQIGVLWSAKLDPTINADILLADANLLRGLFATTGYKPDTIVQDASLSDGSFLVFKGADAEGHTTQLTLSGDLKDEKDGKKRMTPTALLLHYIEDPKNPDTFKLQDGQF
jgi:hypothetical protein